MHMRTTPRAVPVLLLVLLIGAAALPSAQRRRTDNASFGAPVATNTILAAPDAYVGKTITVSAGVEQILSPSVFLVDQRIAIGTSEVKAAGKPLLVLAPYLRAPLDETSRQGYLLVRGEIIRFDKAKIGMVPAGFDPGLSPEVLAQYHGQPVLVATLVLDSTYAVLGRKPPPPPTPEEIALTAAMKVIASNSAALRTATQEADSAAIAPAVAALAPAFSRVEAIFDDLGQSPAAQLARDAREGAVGTGRAVTAGDWNAAKASATAMNATCGACHGAYRDRQEDGTFRLRPGSY